MNPRDSRVEYQARMQRVLDHIERHLDQPLDLATLADVAHFSPFHFHRLFSAWTGETLGEHLRRRRLETAAMRMVAQPRLSVLMVALDVGFGSGEAFTRAFRARFGCAPSAWRQQERARRLHQRKIGQGGRNPGQDGGRPKPEDAGPRQPSSEFLVNVILIDRDPVTLATLRHTGPYGEPVSRFWREQVVSWMLRDGLMAQPRYGLGHDDPHITAPEQCRYDAGVEAPPGYRPGPPVQTSRLPGGRYAALKFRGTVAELGPAWAALLGEWLPASGLQLDARPMFEHYAPGSTWDPATGVFDCEVCIPVVPL